MSLAQHIRIIKICGWRNWFVGGLRYHPVTLWIERVIYCHHNARVLSDMEYRLACVLDTATGGQMSKPYYEKDIMLAEIEDYLNNERDEAYNAGYNDAKEEYAQ